jgi:acyl-homoserine lactone acylase PvdQ
MKPIKFLFLFIAYIALSCSTPQHTTELERWEEHAANTEIIRDDFGVPHIYGKTDANAVFGLLYAQCEDDFNRVEQNYIWATGRLAEVEGEEAIYSDLRANLFMTKDEAVKAYENSPEWLNGCPCTLVKDPLVVTSNAYLFEKLRLFMAQMILIRLLLSMIL